MKIMARLKSYFKVLFMLTRLPLSIAVSFSALAGFLIYRSWLKQEGFFYAYRNILAVVSSLNAEPVSGEGSGCPYE